MRNIVVIAIVGIVFIIGLSALSGRIETSKKESKMNGVSIVSPPRKVPSSTFAPVTKTKANWVALIPYAFSRSGQPNVWHDYSRQWWGERRDGIIELIKYARMYNFQIMIKPHVWIGGEGWPGDYELYTDQDWAIWEKDYKDYLMSYATLADSMDIEMLCIGTEFRRTVEKREKFWRSLAQDVKEVYKGKITYAANWDNYQKVKFWDELDYVGIDAYFPVAEGDSPSVKDLEVGWQKEYENLKSFSAEVGKPILFAEFGYQSVNGAAGKHWEVDKSEASLNMNVQANAYKALFNTFWDEDWFAGGFLWKWHLREGRGGAQNPNFTPQGKPAEEVIANYYSRFSNAHQ